ncbi:MAG: zinc-dependent peptidase [Ferruginibacter sp.]
MPQDTTIILPTADSNYISQQFIDSLSNAITNTSTGYGKTDFQTESESYSQWALPGSVFLLLGLWVIIKKSGKNDNSYVEIGTGADDNAAAQTYTVSQDYLRYDGRSLNFSDELLTTVLVKHFPYFNSLSQQNQGKFLYRLKKFIAAKIFLIHDTSGFKEMPILISAAAIQLSFCLEKYILPNFTFIHIYPQDFLGTFPTIRFLEGNVSGRSINISWKHFLLGFQFSSNGDNVGLHEMAHAYYFQNFECSQYIDSNFVKAFPDFNNWGNKVFEREHQPGIDFYSEYALKNFQEFWAESIEIFFEKPMQMKTIYPDLYKAISTLLNQDPNNPGVEINTLAD